VPDRGWKRAFDEPIPLPRGRELVTLEEAGKLPKAGHEAPEWQAAMEALILVATKGGPTMLARIGAEEMDRLRRGGEKWISPMPSRLSRFSKTECWHPPRRLLVR
jgi:hypothetical protein